MVDRKDCAIVVLVVFMLGVMLYPAIIAALEYDPWCDNNHDGKIRVDDILNVALRFGTDGTPITEAVLAYDSGWINITDKAGQSFNVVHNLSNQNIMVDIVGKAEAYGGVHQRNLGGIYYEEGWTRTLGNVSDQYARSLIQTSDGGYAIAGCTYGTDVYSDILLVKTDRYGNLEWNATYGGSYAEFAYSLIQTSDGGYAIAGSTNSWGVGGDFYLVKTDSAGDMEWQRNYGGGNPDEAYCVIQTSDGGYAIAGYTDSFGDTDGDFFLIKTDESGSAIWWQNYGGDDKEVAWSVVERSPSGYMLAGYTYSYGLDGDVYLVRVASNGSKITDYNWGGPDDQKAYSMVPTRDGGYALAGSVDNVDVYLIKTNSDGYLEWERSYGTIYQEIGYSVVQTVDGGYAIAGNGYTPGGPAIDYLLIKTNPDGHMQWNKTYDLWINDFAHSVIQTDDGGYVMAGYAYMETPIQAEYWVVKTAVASGLVWTDSDDSWITLYRGATDPYWNYVRVRIWETQTP